MADDIPDEVYTTMFSRLERESSNSKSDKIIKACEEEFSGVVTSPEQDREMEISSILKKIKFLKSQITKNSNVRNHKFTELNASRALKRKNFRREIELCNLRLREIKEESSGSEISSVELVQGKRN